MGIYVVPKNCPFMLDICYWRPVLLVFLYADIFFPLHIKKRSSSNSNYSICLVRLYLLHIVMWLGVLGDNGGLWSGVHAGAVGDLGEVLMLLKVEGGVVLMGVAGH